MMKGSMLIFKPGVTDPKRIDLTKPPTASTLHKIVGGYIELVPHFESIGLDGDSFSCVAFCNEEGKLLNLPYNDAATKAWHFDLAPLVTSDVLVGNVVIVFGDDEFMANL
jgi:hypothetical protein